VTQTIPQAAKPGIKSSASLRCSRPLCSSQNTGGTPCNPIRRSDHTRVRRPSPCGELVQRSVTASSRMPAGPSGPNSVQKTRLDSSIRSDPQADVLRGKSLTWSQCQCSTHERHRRTYVSEMATRSNSAVYRRILECSLERR